MTDRSRSTYRFFTYPHQRQRSVPEQILLEPTTIYRRGGIVFDCGFDDAAISTHWGAIGGPVLDSTIAGRTGTNAARIDVTADTTLRNLIASLGAARSVTVLSLRFRVSALPTTTARLFTLSGTSFYNPTLLLYNDGTLGYSNGGTAPDGPVIVPNRWYRIDLATDGLNKLGKWSVDGVAQTDPGPAANVDTHGDLYLGKSNGIDSGAFSYYFDDVAVSTTWADYPIGPGSVQTPYAPTVLPDAPVAYWQLGEASGNPQDSSGNGHNVTVVGGTPTYGQTGPVIGTTAVAFDGSTEYFTAPSGIDVADVFTLEAWIIPGATGASRGLICLSDGQYLRILNTGELTLNQASVGIIVRSTINPSAGVWSHVVATKNGATVKLYINGVDVTGTVTNQTFVSFAGIAHIAESNSSSERFNGSIGQAAVYNTALSATQVLAHYASAEAWFQSFTADAVVKKTVSGSFTANAVIKRTWGGARYSSLVGAHGPVAYWRLGEPSGTTAVAEVGPNGTYQNTPTLGVAGSLTGDANTAVTFDRASTESVQIATGMPAGNSTGYSVEMWLNHPVILVDGQEQTLWSAGDVTGANHRLGYRYFSPTDYILYWYYWDGALRQPAVANLGPTNGLDGGRHHLVLTHDYAGKSAKVYVDGALHTTTDLSAFGTVSPVAANAASRIAGYSGNDLTMSDGTFDEVAIYTSILTPTQVTAHYQSGAGTSSSFTANAVIRKTMQPYQGVVQSDSPLGYWRLGEPAGFTADDLGSGNHDGTYIDTPTLGAAGIPGGGGNTAVALGSTEYVTTTWSTIPAPPLSLECWVKFAGNVDDTSLGGWFSSAGVLACQLYLLGSENVRIGTEQGNANANCPNLQDGNWHHIVGTIDGTNGNARLYYDGALVAGPSAVTFNGGASAHPFWIGRYFFATSSINGTIDEWAVYPTALSLAQIQAHYIAGTSGISGSFTANAVIAKTMQPYRGVVLGDVPVAYWRLGESGTPATAVHVCGAECSSLGTHWSITGAVTTDTTIKRNGTGSMKVAATGSGISAQATLGSATHKVVRLSLYLNALPSASAMLALAVSNAQANAYLGFDVATGKLTVSHQGSYASRTQATTTIQAQRWYTLDLDFDNTAGAPTIRWRIDGVAQTTHVGAGPTGTFENFLIGQGDAGQIPDTTYTAYFDDIVISHTAADYPITFGAVAGTSPETWATALDSSGNARHGSYINNPTLGVTGSLTSDADTAVTFNGTNQQITVADSTAVRGAGTSSFSIEAWFNHTQTAHYRSIAACLNAGSNGWELFSHQGDFGFGRRTAAANNYAEIFTPVAVGWHHVVATFDGTNQRLYLDGTLIATSGANTGSMPSDSSMVIAGPAGLGEPLTLFNGTIDEVAFYNAVLTPTQIVAHYITAKSGTVGFTADAIFVPSAGGVATISGSFTANAVKKSTITGSFTANAVLRKTMQPYRGLIVGQQPIAYWRLGESSGSTAAAVVGPTGTYVNTPTLGVTGLLAGDPDTAVTFVRASDEYVSVPTGMAAGASAGASMSARISLASITALHFVLRWGPQNASPGYHVMFIDAGGSLRWQYAATSDWFDTSSPALIAAGTTYHVAVSHTYATKQVSFYINGVLVGVEDESANPAPLVPPANAATFIGAYAGTLQQFDGTLDEVTVFSRPLTAAEVLEQYITAKGGIVGFTADASLVKTTTGTITANAVIRRTQTSSTTADAVKRSTVAGSLTADAVKKSTVAGSFTANAALKKTTSGTFLADAVKKSTAAGSTTANAVLFRATQTGSFTANAAKVRTITGTFTANATILRTQTGSFTANAAIKATLSGSTTANAVKFKANQLGSLTANAIKRQTFSGSWTADATLKRTQLGSLTANAVIFASRAGSTTANAVIMPRFAADAIIRRTQTGSFVGSAVIMPVFRANATIKATLQGSLTADAWILSLTGNGGSLSARAVLFASLAATTTANAVKLKAASGSFTAQAVIRVTIASSFTASAVVKRTATATFTADAVFIRARAGSFTADAIRRRTQTGAFTGDAIRRSTTTGSIAASAVLRKTILPTFTVDSVVLKARTGTFAANAVVLKVQVATVAADAVLKVTRTSSFSMAAIIARSGSGSFTANAYILSPTAGANTFFADAIVKASRAGSTTAGATILRARSGSFTAAALILATRAGSTTANAVVKASLTRTFAADAVIKASRSGTFTVDAFRAQTQTGSFTASALVRRSQFGTLPISAVLRGPRSASFFADAWKTKIVSASFTASAWTVATRTAGFATAATIRRQQTQTFTADAVRRASRAGVTTADATTRRTASASITADASIVGAGQNSFKADAVKRESFAGSLTADAQIDDGKRAGDFTVDAVLDVLRSSFPLTSTLSVAKMTASITGPHLSATVGSHHLQSRLGWSRSERSFTANAVIA